MVKTQFQTFRNAAGAVAAIVLAAGCSNAGGSSATPASGFSQTDAIGSDISPDVSLLKQLKKQVVIGSTVDPVNGAGNPYGLTVAPITAGDFTKGDLVICNFNAKSNKQGTGRSIIALHAAQARVRPTFRRSWR